MYVMGFIPAAIDIFYGVLIFYAVYKLRNHPGRTVKNKISEIVFGILYIVNGLLVPFIYDTVSEPVANMLYTAQIAVLTVILAFLWGNLLYTAIRLKKHPELLDKEKMLKGEVVARDIEIFYSQIEAKYRDKTKAKNSDIIKDIARKFLHMLMLFVIVSAHEFSKMIAPTLAQYGITAIAFRNFLYQISGFFFLYMFTTADIFRLLAPQYLPDWAYKLYDRALEIKTEKYTYISAIPFLLTVMCFIMQPFAVILSAAIVACVSDAAASIVGKTIGRHKLGKFGIHPNKSWEGLIAGALSAFLGIFLVFRFYPVSGVTLGWQLGFAVAVAIAFIYTDAFERYVVDNVMNLLLPGLIIGIPIYLLF